MNEASSSSSERILDAAAIQQVLPHRYPFLLVDRIVALTEDTVVGVKCVTINEPFFQGHFPGDPIMPGVLVVEGLGQTGAVGLLEARPDEWSMTHLAAIERARFRRPVKPGDRLTYDVTLGDPRRGFIKMEGSATVNEKEVARATITLSLQSDANI